MKPIEWAKALCEKHGWKDGHRIANDCARPKLGKDADTPNPMLKFYTPALEWIKKNAPAKELETDSDKQLSFQL